jgi:hypothetical protein
MPQGRVPVTALAAGGLLFLGLGWAPVRGSEGTPDDPARLALSAAADLSAMAACVADPEPPEYYEFRLVRTTRVPGTGLAKGTGATTFARSPFGVAIAPNGDYVLDVAVTVTGLKPPRQGDYVVWITDQTLEKVVRVGALDESFRIHGRSIWNKFLVVVTLEAEDDPDAQLWSGPVVLRGMSRSGLMHTMLGHGPFQEENCPASGFAN